MKRLSEFEVEREGDKESIPVSSSIRVNLHTLLINESILVLFDLKEVQIK